MTRYVIDFWLDGYDSDEERIKAEQEFIMDQLDMTASGIKIIEVIKDNYEQTNV